MKLWLILVFLIKNLLNQVKPDEFVLISRNKPATSRTVYLADRQPSWANDGVYQQIESSSIKCYISKHISGNPEYWQVDLLHQFQIASVTIFNRVHSANIPLRLKKISIHILKVSSESVDDSNKCHYFDTCLLYTSPSPRD